ncbi:HpcH/HpaI aldolase family protein [Paraburkholderia sp. BCC1885]|uniref:HpcH/HpaI aldolase family protein n=1 Tax=Paraburkholderia sp. BCC1885 TaxID=2562669 RepID=UPI0011845BDD|nr:aldolase/citrate lyase family protein [Paraburkholderia sp. BCC1885]
MTQFKEFAEKIRSGKPLLGTWMHVPHPMVAELMAQTGFDFILLDGEHAPVPPDILYTLLPSTEKFSMPVLYRVRANTPDLIKAALDNGVTALIAPMVNSGREASAVVSAAKYPPVGLRGIGPLRASNYYLDEASYVSVANETATVVQIETAAALEAVEDIAATPGIDALYLGPADLSMSLGLPLGQLSDGLRAACRRVAEAARKNGIGAGIDVASLDYVPVYRDFGFNLMTYGLDTNFLVQGGRNCSEAMRKAIAC